MGMKPECTRALSLVSPHLPVSVTGYHQQPLNPGAISPHLCRSSRGLSASTPSSDCLVDVFSILIASHIIWHQRGRDKSRCLPSLAGAHYKNIKISHAERQGELMISLCHRCPSMQPPPHTWTVPDHVMQKQTWVEEKVLGEDEHRNICFNIKIPNLFMTVGLVWPLIVGKRN